MYLSAIIKKYIYTTFIRIHTTDYIHMFFLSFSFGHNESIAQVLNSSVNWLLTHSFLTEY